MLEKNYLVTATIGNPANPSRTDVIGVYKRKLMAMHSSVNVLVNGFYAPTVVSNNYHSRKNLKVISRQYRPLSVFIEYTDSDVYLDADKEKGAINYYYKYITSTIKYLTHKKIKCKLCNNELTYNEKSQINAEFPTSILCTAEGCKSRIIDMTEEERERNEE